MDPTEPQWRVNSSFSPPPSRRWDCRYRSDGLSHVNHGAPMYGSSLSSHSKGSRSILSSGQYHNHQHSVSDGALSYMGSPFDNFHAQRFDHGEFSTPIGGARPQSAEFAQSNDRSSAAGASSLSNSLGSASPPSESSRRASKQPIFFPPRNFSCKRSFMSKPVYPLVFRNPVADESYGMTDASVSSRTTPGDHYKRTSPEVTLSTELKFHRSLTELQMMEASPELSTSSRRDGFRWSNASSYDFGFEGDAIDITEVDYLKSPNSSARRQKCGLCERLLSQKSPWSSHRIVRSGDMPIVGILSCRHVFHAECLEETTPKVQLHEPPCPLCLKVVCNEGSSSSSPLLAASRSIHRNRGVTKVGSYGIGGDNNPSPGERNGDFRRNKSLLPMVRREGSLIKNHFKKRFSFKGKMGRDIFGARIFGRAGASSSSSLLHENHSQSGRSRARQSSRLSGL